MNGEKVTYSFEVVTRRSDRPDASLRITMEDIPADAAHQPDYLFAGFVKYFDSSVVSPKPKPANEGGHA